MHLRDYQERTVTAALSANVPVLVVAPTGAGKTRIAVGILERIAGRALFIVHRRELLIQADQILQRFNLRDRVEPYTVQGLLASGHRPLCDTIVFDECFPAGTMVGAKTIETLQVGDLVPCFNHKTNEIALRRVVRKFVRPAPCKMVRIKTSTHSIICTENHPIFCNNRGYVAASNVLCNDEVFYAKSHDLRGLQYQFSAPTQGTLSRYSSLWGGLQGGAQGSQEEEAALCTVWPDRSDPHQDAAGGGGEGQAILLDPMPKHRQVYSSLSHDDENKSAVCLRTNEDEQSNEVGEVQAEDEGFIVGDRPQTHYSRWQWEANSSTSKNTSRSPRVRMGDGIWSQHGWSIPITSRDQNRYCESSKKSRSGSRRDESWNLKDQGCRPQEIRLPSFARVESIEILESTGDSGSAGLCPDGYVYNIEVEEHNNYFADGFLVHNCHHYAADDWRSIHSHYSTQRCIGLTATPERIDGRPLGDLFSELIVAAQYSELLRDGHLVPCRVVRPSELLKRGLAQNPVDAYIKHGNGGSGFVYAPRVEEAQRLAVEFTERGIPAACVNDRTPADERDSAINGLRSGRYRLLTNVYALTEGVDVPTASVCILARGMGHITPYLQMAGRVLRPAPGKTEAILIDLPGVSHEFGFPTEDRIYSLSGQGIRAASDAVTVCLNCGASYASGPIKCPVCGFVKPYEEWQPLKIYGAELRAVYMGAATPDDAMRTEYLRLRAFAKSKGWSIEWVIKQYKLLFGSNPKLDDVSAEERFDEYERLRKIGAERGFKPGFPAARYLSIFGTWPARNRPTATDPHSTGA